MVIDGPLGQGGLRMPRFVSDHDAAPSDLFGANVFGTQEKTSRLEATDPAAAATILVVDDESEVRTVVAECLEDSGYRVLQADCASAALERLDRDTDVQLLITDIRMPNMSGIELADRAEQQHPELKVILISGYFIGQPIRHRLLRKPFRMNELQKAVQNELASGA